MGAGKILYWLLGVILGGVPSFLIGRSLWNWFEIGKKDKETIRFIVVQLDAVFKAWTDRTPGKGPKTDDARAEMEKLACRLSDRRQNVRFKDDLKRYTDDPYPQAAARVTKLKEAALKLIGESGKTSEDARK